HMLTALPRVDGSSDPQDLSNGVANAVQQLAAMTPGRHAPKVRMLPETLDRRDLLATLEGWGTIMPGRKNASIPIGINESELAPVFLNFNEQPHFLIFGDTECGKTTLLRGICQGIMESNRPQEAAIILADYRRT